MASLKIKQEAKERGEWNDLPEQQREELEKSYQTAGRVARYMNIMGIKTVLTHLLNEFLHLSLFDSFS